MNDLGCFRARILGALAPVALLHEEVSDPPSIILAWSVTETGYWVGNSGPRVPFAPCEWAGTEVTAQASAEWKGREGQALIFSGFDKQIPLLRREKSAVLSWPRDSSFYSVIHSCDPARVSGCRTPLNLEVKTVLEWVPSDYPAVEWREKMLLHLRLMGAQSITKHFGISQADMAEAFRSLPERHPDRLKFEALV